MATAVHDEQTFAKGSPVLAYWLAHSEGFRVRGSRGSAIVDDVFMRPQGSVTALALRSRVLRRRRMLDADAVVAVVPGERVLVVGRRPRNRRARAVAVGTARGLGITTVVLARTARPYVVDAARRLAVTTVVLARVAQPHALALGQLALRTAARGLAKARDGDAARRWIGIQAGNAIVVASALRSAISRCSSSAAAAASAARSSAAASARAARSSRGSSSS
ncbi:MAG TPA: hypothetical protein VLN26_02520 [Gaiellaceae bacterium]|nr:hypothetical protein [Gaiellaceae bacterium]